MTRASQRNHWGERVTWETDGNFQQTVVTGFACRGGLDLGLDAESEREVPRPRPVVAPADLVFDPMIDRNRDGTLSPVVDGWNTRFSASGGTEVPVMRAYPSRLGGARLSDFITVGGAWAKGNTLIEDADGAVVDCGLDEVDEDLDGDARFRFS